MRKAQETSATNCVIHMIGHGHIDPTWLWRWTEGYEEVRATFRSALDRMKETPHFVFTASSACFYAWVKACEPAMFEEIRARVQEGRWDIAGGWWVEPDCNIPGGESFARHGLYAQRFFAREFGVRAKVGFNPDSFGHAGTFPQIFRKQGIDYYVYMRPAPDIEMAYPAGTTFRWCAADGTEIVACNLQECYNADGEGVRDRIGRLPSSPHLNPGQRHILGFYGVGNHGGGPTKRAIAEILKAQRDPHAPEVRFSTLAQYFDAFLASTSAEALPVVTTDLQHHARGCYSVHSEVKRLNRRAEHALMIAERWATVRWLAGQGGARAQGAARGARGAQAGCAYPAERIEGAWKTVLYNQFHDILAGTSIESAYEDVRDQMGGAIHTAHDVLNESIQALAARIDTSAEGNTIVVVNPLPWPVKQAVKATNHAACTLETPIHIVDERGKAIPSQAVLGERINHTDYAFTAEVPALGYRCFHARSGAKAIRTKGLLRAGRDFIENAWWRIDLDPYDGHISRLYDKANGIEVLEKGAVLAALVDSSDTWSHGYEEWRQEAGRFGEARLHLIEAGAVRATIWAKSRFGQSVADQFFTLYRDVDTIDVVVRVNWQERYTMLKLAFETRVRQGVATYDVAYGSQERAASGTEEPGQKWIDLTGLANGRPYGFAVLNDSKYSFDVREGTLRVTLLRSPAYAHHDNARHDASTPYPVMDQGWQTVRLRLVPHAGSWQEAGIVRRAWELNEPPFTHIESAHRGPLPSSASFLAVDGDSVALTVFKKSEDGEDLILRGYETAGRKAKVRIQLAQWKKKIDVSFAPHEIKTIRVNPKTWAWREVNLIEEQS